MSTVSGADTAQFKGIAPGVDSLDAEALADELGERFGAARDAISNYIFGQTTVIDQVLISMLAGGNALLIGVPGLAKTRLVDTLGTVLGMDTKRIQFTHDPMPGDIVGSEVLKKEEPARRTFRFVKGPVFCQFLMADEINRASPRTQSALLQAMRESHVTIAGQGYDLPRPFHVLATQNPLEQEGTYPLPEAQLDRFLLQVDVGYPDRGAERRMLFATTGSEERRVEQIITAQELQSIQRLVRQLPVPDKVVEAILKLTRSARPGTGAGGETDRLIAWGPAPRASQALMLAVRAKALIDGRLAPSVDDVIALADVFLRHRVALTCAARAEGQEINAIIGRLARAVE